VGRHSVLWADDRDALRHSVRLDWKGPSLTDRLSDLLGRKWTLYALWVILALVRAASYPIALTAVSCSRERRKDLASMAGRKAFCWHRRRHLASHDGSVHMSVYRIPPSTVADSFRRVVPRQPARSPHHVVLHLVFNRRLEGGKYRESVVQYSNSHGNLPSAPRCFAPVDTTPQFHFER
jgi:hypothetical protein